MLPYFQLNGHHNAELDPLGISCINFDDAPVPTGVQNVGEKCSLTAVRDNNELVCVNVAFPFPPSFFSLLLFFFQIPFNTSMSLYTHTPPPLTPTCRMFCSISPRTCFFRSVGTMLLSWTRWGLWMPIWTLTSPMTL